VAAWPGPGSRRWASRRSCATWTAWTALAGGRFRRGWATQGPVGVMKIYALVALAPAPQPA